MYREKQIWNNPVYESIHAAEIKEIALEFTESLLGIIAGEQLDSILIETDNSEAKIYINLLPLFEGVAEIINSKIEIEEIKNNGVKAIIEIVYISDRMEKKAGRIEYKLFLQRNELGVYEIESAGE